MGELEFFSILIIAIVSGVIVSVLTVITQPLWRNILKKYLQKREFSSQLKQLKKYPNPINKTQAMIIICELRKFSQNNYFVFGLNLTITIVTRLQIIEERVNMKSPQNNLNIAIDDTLTAIKKL